MILVDVNLLVYAYAQLLPEHERAQKWLDGELSGLGRVGMPWSSLLGFIRVVSNPRAFGEASTVQAAWSQVEDWLDCPNVWIPEPGARHRALLGQMFGQMGGGPRLVSDAHLAALGIEHGLTLCSTDGDFARFRGLRWQNPLVVGQFQTDPLPTHSFD